MQHQLVMEQNVTNSLIQFHTNGMQLYVMSLDVVNDLGCPIALLPRSCYKIMSFVRKSIDILSAVSLIYNALLKISSQHDPVCLDMADSNKLLPAIGVYLEIWLSQCLTSRFRLLYRARNEAQSGAYCNPAPRTM